METTSSIVAPAAPSVPWGVRRQEWGAAASMASAIGLLRHRKGPSVYHHLRYRKPSFREDPY